MGESEVFRNGHNKRVLKILLCQRCGKPRWGWSNNGDELHWKLFSVLCQLGIRSSEFYLSFIVTIRIYSLKENIAAFMTDIFYIFIFMRNRNFYVICFCLSLSSLVLHQTSMTTSIFYVHCHNFEIFCWKMLDTTFCVLRKFYIHVNNGN